MKAACLLVLCWALPAAADETVSVCFNYGCAEQRVVTVAPARLAALHDLLATAGGAEQERQAIRRAIGALYDMAASQTPIAADRGGNLADGEHEGRMDCIDHSTTTTAMLRMIDRQGWLRFHHPIDRALRRRFVVAEHWSAVIEDAAGERFVVDSWFGGASRPPVVMPQAEWEDGGGEIVE
jgi:hypothetical protein